MYLESRRDSIFRDSSFIDINDSTYTFSRFLNDNDEWYFTNYNNSSFLVLGNSTIGVKRINDSIIEGVNLSYEDVTYEFRLRAPKWKKEKLYGKWVEDKYYNTSEDFFPPQPPPIPEKYDWPPFYEISEDKIINNHYNVNESKYKINNSNEYLSMQLRSYFYNKEIKWRIKEVTDSMIIINRKIGNSYQDNYSNKFSEDIKLIRLVIAKL